MPDEPLNPNDFPVEAHEERLVTNGGKPVASAKSKKVAEDIADRPNQDAEQQEQDRWSA